MSNHAVEQLASYVDALRPIIYINHFDFNAVDNLIEKVVNQGDVGEYNDADGFVDFRHKNPKFESDEYNLETVLSLFNSEDKVETFLVLKDIHHYLETPKVIALLKSIALKTINRDSFYIIHVYHTNSYTNLMQLKLVIVTPRTIVSVSIVGSKRSYLKN